jgi:hypothetical protein
MNPLKGSTIRIGAFDVKRTCVSPALDSAACLALEDWGILAMRLQVEGYLAFSGFFAEEETASALEEVRKLSKARTGGGLLGLLKKPKAGGFVVNLRTGRSIGGADEDDTEGFVERWKALGESDCIQRFYRHDRLKTMLRGVLGQVGDVAVPEEITFQLAWVRCKSKNEGTDVHIVSLVLLQCACLSQRLLRIITTWIQRLRERICLMRAHTSLTMCGQDCRPLRGTLHSLQYGNIFGVHSSCVKLTSRI